MKLIENMAMLKAGEISNPFLSHTDNFEYGFEAGFRAAREMAVAKSKGYAHTKLCDRICELVQDIERLGEEEYEAK